MRFLLLPQKLGECLQRRRFELGTIRRCDTSFIHLDFSELQITSCAVYLFTKTSLLSRLLKLKCCFRDKLTICTICPHTQFVFSEDVFYSVIFCVIFLLFYYYNYYSIAYIINRLLKDFAIRSGDSVMHTLQDNSAYNYN